MGKGVSISPIDSDEGFGTPALMIVGGPSSVPSAVDR